MSNAVLNLVRYGLLTGLLWMGGCPLQIRAQGPKAVHLQTQAEQNPLAVGTLAPELSWWGEEARPAARQTAYALEIWRAGGRGIHAHKVVYRSKRVASSDQTAQVPPGLLESDGRYAWRVRLWDEQGHEGAWSEPASFGTGLLAAKDWGAARWVAFREEERWQREWKNRKAQERLRYSTNELTPVVTSAHMTSWQLLDSVTPRYDPAPLLRKTFLVRRPVRSARLYVSGVGYAVSWLNGRRLDDAVLDPGWTNYDKDVLYRSFDVTDLLKPGGNALGMMLGRGFYGMLANDRWGFAEHAPWVAQPALKVMLRIAYDDGSKQEVVTDESWTVHGGPVLYDDPWLGEVYDAREEQGSWTSEDFDDATWEHVHAVPGPAGTLRPQVMPAIRPAEPIPPKSMQEVRPGVWEIDLGMNTAGWMCVEVQGKAGDRVLVQMAEKPDPATFIDRTTNNFQQFGYILKGGARETAESHFAYMGFRYVRITAHGSGSKLPALQAAVAVPVHTDLSSVGKWNSSNELLNRINAVWRRTMLNNATSLPTDCPHREKLGWMADAFVAQPAGLYSFGAESFYDNFIHDLAGTASTAGTLSTIAPSFGYTEGESPLWASAEVLIPWRLYTFDGNLDVLRQQLPTIQRFLSATLKNNAIAGKPFVLRDVLGDWDSPGHENPPEGQQAYSTAYFYLDCRLAAQMAHVLHDEATATIFETLAGQVQQAFVRWFYSPAKQVFHGDKPAGYRQSINALALWAGLVPEDERAGVYAHLREDVLAHSDHLDTGIIGTKPLLEVLAGEGDTDLVYRVITQQTYPSWGYMIAEGATTMWESWDGRDSLDHPMQGTIVEFLYRYLAGVRVEEDHPGFSQFRLEPIFPTALEGVQASFDSKRGEITSAWRREGPGIVLHVRVPFNSTAQLTLTRAANPPCPLAAVDAGPAVTKNGARRYEVPSGDHVFRLACQPY